MGFTFLMDANTSKYFYNHFMGMHEANSNKPLKNIKKISGIQRLVLPFPDTYLKNIFVYFYFISIEHPLGRNCPTNENNDVFLTWQKKVSCLDRRLYNLTKTSD